VTELKEELSKVDYMAIRKIYLEAPAIRGVKPVWRPIDRDRLVSFLVKEHSFSLERVQAAIARLEKSAPASETLEKWFG
jgi:hypothetical protein